MVAIMIDDPKIEYENNNVEKKRKTDQQRWLSKNYQLNVGKKVEHIEVTATSSKNKWECKEKIKRKQK